MSTGMEVQFGLFGGFLLAIVALVFLIARSKFHASIALLLASLIMGFVSGMEGKQILKAFQDGVGTMLGNIAFVVGLGAILGKLLEISGGATVVANTLIHAWGEKNLPWTMLGVGFFVGLPVFFSVGLVLLTPVLFSVRKVSKSPLLSLAIPLIAGLSAAHGLVPPHPGPMAAIKVLKIDTGKTIGLSIAIGLPVAAFSVWLLSKWIPKLIPSLSASRETDSNTTPALPKSTPPTFWKTAFTILLPALLMLSSTIVSMAFPKAVDLNKIFAFLGDPVAAMLITVLVSFKVFGSDCGHSRDQLLKAADASLGPIAAILLVVGAGGGFNGVLTASGIGKAIATMTAKMQLNPLLMGWTIAVMIRVATGSATVAITTAAGMMDPVLAANPAVNKELVVVAMGAGSLILSHLNDGGFWFVKECLGLSVAETLKSWTLLETLLSILALLVCLAVSLVL